MSGCGARVTKASVVAGVQVGGMGDVVGHRPAGMRRPFGCRDRRLGRARSYPGVAIVGPWTERDFAWVTLSEPGTVEVMRAVLDACIGNAAGIWSPKSRSGSAWSGLADRAMRVLVEVMVGSGAAAAASARGIDGALDRLGVREPRLHHGEE
jgi:hypothetical protein